MAWKQAVTKVSSNIFSDMDTGQYSKDIGMYEASPNMPLQATLFFNAYLYPIWLSITSYFLYLKIDCLGDLTKFLSLTVLSMTSVIEGLRLYLGFTGNLSEQIPELAGFWMLSVLLQLPLQTFHLANPYLQNRPLELIMHSLMWLFLVAQLVTGFFALRAASLRAKQYYYFVTLAKKSAADQEKERKSAVKSKAD